MLTPLLKFKLHVCKQQHPPTASYMQKYLPFIIYYGSGFVVVYKYFDRSQHIGLSDPTCVQNFRPVPLMAFEILGFKLKNKNNDKSMM